jgi:flagellar biosynthesis component FlhA
MSWLLARWKKSAPTTGGLTLYLAAPSLEVDRGTQLKLADLVKQKLANGFFQSAQEKGWPLPRFFVSTESESIDDHWTYWFQLGPYRTEAVVFHPNKILAVGEEQALAPLLGLECVDPVFGLPAKWVTYSQSERASGQGALLFDAAEVIMSHAISFAESRMEHAIGQWEVSRWMVPALSSSDEMVCRLLQEQAPLLLRLTRNFLAEGLYLPAPSQFCEHLTQALSALSNDPAGIEETVRTAVVRHNLPRWMDETGCLTVVEWKGPSELRAQDHHRMLGRLSQALEVAYESLTSGTPVLLAELAQRQHLATALEGLFPELPVLAWSELEDLSNIRIMSTINAKLQVHPSVLPAKFFSIN